MKLNELTDLIACGEDSRHQFKADVTNELSLAQELAAFSNTGGGTLLIGVSDDGKVRGLSAEDVARLNQLISNAASQSVRPPVNPITENVRHPNGLVIVVQVPDGISKPYMDRDGVVWLKSAGDKRKATSREEIQRLFQSASLVHGDEVPVSGTTVDDIDLWSFNQFYEKEFDDRIENDRAALSRVLRNLNLLRDGALNVAGTLLFGKHPELCLPAFVVKCVAYPGSDIHVSEYRDSEDIGGPLRVAFDRTMGFLLRNIAHLQNGRDINSVGEPEIPRIALEELVINALVHRDYFISAPVRVFVFDDRIEIINPGHLPNNLTIENIKSGNSNIRNPILASFAAKLLPYRGLGNGVRRALKAYPRIEFEDDREGCLFTVRIARAQSNQILRT